MARRSRSLLFRACPIPFQNNPQRAVVAYDTDGDTFWAHRDGGCGTDHLVEIRLTAGGWVGIDAYERGTPLGDAARAFVLKFLPEWTYVLTHTYRDPEVYGRYLSPLYVPANTPLGAESAHRTRIDGLDYVDLALVLIDRGLAVFKDYGPHTAHTARSST